MCEEPSPEGGIIRLSMSWEVWAPPWEKQGGGPCTKHDGAALEFQSKTTGEEEAGEEEEDEEGPTQNMTEYVSKADGEHW